MRKCKNCEQETKNKVYCSVTCQHTGYKTLKAKRIECECLLCNSKFEVKEYDITLGRGKYCSRKCKDTHQKELYLGEGNPVYGSEHSEEWKLNTSIRFKDLWNSDEHRNKVKEGQERFFEMNGFWMGTDEISLEKRVKTNIERYGVACVLSLDEYIELREKICMEKYGKTSLELMRLGNKKKKGTSIEVKIGKLLLELGIKFESQYEINVGNNNCKIYDFFLPDYNLLIEADGDYYHVNPKIYSDDNFLDKIQIENIINDKVKNDLAKEKNINLVRFWECDIRKKNFKFKLIETIKKYGKN